MTISFYSCIYSFCFLFEKSLILIKVNFGNSLIIANFVNALYTATQELMLI